MNPSARFVDIAFGVLCGVLPQPVLSYETPVHSAMTEAAFNQAVKEYDFLSDLGVHHFFDASGNLFFSEDFLGYTPLQWTQTGSVAEDDIPRSKNHFFDPTAKPPYQGFRGLFEAAPDWAVDATDNATCSIPGARNSLYNALTSTDPFLRPKFWRDTFRGLGLTPLLQDMAQPQHVRDDNHFSQTKNFYWLFPDYSRYEKALTYLNGGAKAKYGPVLDALLPFMPEIIASYSPLAKASISSNTGEYAIRRVNNGVQMIYLI